MLSLHLIYNEEEIGHSCAVTLANNVIPRLTMRTLLSSIVTVKGS
jgi:hypothetical protein